MTAPRRDARTAEQSIERIGAIVAALDAELNLCPVAVHVSLEIGRTAAGDAVSASVSFQRSAAR